MNAIIGMTGLLLETPLTLEQREQLTMVRDAGDGLLTVINDILDYSKIESGRLELDQHDFDVRDCVEQALDIVAASAAAKGLELGYQCRGRIPVPVVGDSTRLRQVLLNLLSNAIKFTASGGVTVTIAYEAGEAGLHLEVHDTGIGIPSDRLDRLFRSFSQVDASTTRHYGGTGLGLAICKRLCELMGGRIWVESAPGSGSTFHSTVHAPAASGQTATGPVDRPRGRHLLVAVRHEAHRTLIGQLAEEWGMTVTCVDAPEAALAALEHTSFDAVLADFDWTRPDATALRAYFDFNAGPGGIRLILLATRANRDTLPAGPLAIRLNKPIKREALLDALRRACLDDALPSPLRAPELDVSPAGVAGALRIVIAEDNLTNQKVVLKLLERLGYQAKTTGNGVELLQALRSDRYDVVLLDVQMPEMDGLEAAGHIRRMWTDAERPRIIGMTALAMEGDRERCLAAGMDDYITKPIRREALEDALARCQPRVVDGPGALPVRDLPVLGREPLPAAVDVSVLDELRALQGDDDPHFVTGLIDHFLSDTPLRLEQIEAALATGTPKAVERIVHSLKSSCANLGARRMSGLCLDLEKMARAQDLTGARPLAEQIASEFARVSDALSAARSPSSQVA